MRTIDADALQLAIVEEGQANKRKKYIIGDIWELTGAEIREVINSQPTIQPEPHWIPVTENCDCDLMDNEEVLVFQKDGTINGQIRHAMFYDFNGKKKFVTWEEGITIYHVVAYMPLPEPYKGVTT